MIYERFFQLRQRPFSIAPNPSFLYQQGQYREALAALEFGLYQKGGFVLLTGEVGTGKTTLCKQLLTQVPDDTEVALVLHPQLDRLEFLQAICDEFGIEIGEGDGEIKRIHLIHRFLLEQFAAGRNAVLIIDEAQHLDLSVLELVRLLTNLETSEEKLLQIILIGQPELNERLARYELRQLNQRITVRYHLKPLSVMNTARYVRHRMAKVSLRPDQSKHVFSLGALWLLHRLTLGIPRLVNVIADRALMAAYADNKQRVSAWLLYRAAQEVLPTQPKTLHRTRTPKLKMVFLASTFASIMVVALMLLLLPSLVAPSLEQAAKSSPPLAWLEEKINPRESVQASKTTEAARAPSYAQLASYWAVQVRDVCNMPRACWQGYLPLSLLQSAGLEAFVRIDNQWLLVSQLDQELVQNSIMDASQLVEAKLVWQPPFAYREAFKVGDRAPFVGWIRKQISQRQSRGVNQVNSQDPSLLDDSQTKSAYELALEDGWEVIQPAGQTKPIANAVTHSSGNQFDWLLEEQVKQFQADMGLAVDGIAGSQTLLALWLEAQATPQAYDAVLVEEP